MIIKFSDKFESIFYAILLNNLTGDFLVSKNNNMGLFEDEEFIDIDKVNWDQILIEHNNIYGEIKWFNYNNPNFFAFKSTIEHELQKNNVNRYKQVICLIKQALKFGLSFENNFNRSNFLRVRKQVKLVHSFDNTLI